MIDIKETTLNPKLTPNNTFKAKLTYPPYYSRFLVES